MTINRLVFAGLIFSQVQAGFGQTDTDSNKVIQLPTFEFSDKPLKNEIERLPEVAGTLIFSGKKNEVIKLGNIDADLSVNNTRQVFGKVPGVSVWENDGSGIQVGVSTRGLSPNRSWEFNVRQNGYDICSEVFGYPEAYYSPPLEGVERIELVRGAAGLQFGPQMGGLLNYVMKKGSPHKKMVVETQQTVGSFGLYNAYTGLGGTVGKVSYYGYFHHRNSDGWRENNGYSISTGYGSLQYQVNKKLSLGLQYTRMNYVSQQPGGLSDSLFMVNPKQSLRSRNWFNAPWNVSNLNIDYNFSETSRLSVKLFSTHAQRNSVGFAKSITVADTFNQAINSFIPRQVDRNTYENYGAEIRYLKSYKLLGNTSTLAAGTRVYRGKTIRLQQGAGTTGDDFDLTLTNATWGKDMVFGTDNLAFFVENIFKILPKLSITPGIRYEIINSSASGYFKSGNGGNFSRENNRNVLLLGVGTQYEVTSTTNIYSNYSQGYRPVTYSELTPAASTEVLDPNLRDAGGFNFDFGYRGTYKKFLEFDIGGFFLQYDNRIGVISKDNLPYKTNIGTSQGMGAEIFVELDIVKAFTQNSKRGYLSFFASMAFMESKYTRWDNPAIVNDPAKTLVGKKVENAPDQILRFGTTYILKGFSATFQFNQVGETFSDAANTITPNATSTTGLIPGYTVMDGSLTYLFGEKFNVKAGINNIADAAYFTRRAGGYPGPGLMPANGRTLFFGLGAKF